MATIGRNDPCLCGSGKKFKKCCMDSGRFTAAFTVADSVAAFDAVESWAFDDGPSEEEFDQASEEFHELLTDRQMDVLYDDSSPYGQPVQHLMAYWLTVERVRKNGRRGIDELLSGPLPSDRVRACLETLSKTPLRLYRLAFEGDQVTGLVDVLSGAAYPWPSREKMPVRPAAFVAYRLLPDGAGGVVPCPPFVAYDETFGSQLAAEIATLVKMGADAETPETEADILRDFPPMAAKAWADFVCDELGVDQDEHVHDESCDHDDEELGAARFTVPDAEALAAFIDGSDQFEAEDLQEDGKPPSLEFGRVWSWQDGDAVVQLVDGVLHLESPVDSLEADVETLTTLLGELAVFEDMDLEPTDYEFESESWTVLDEPGLLAAIAASPSFTPMDLDAPGQAAGLKHWAIIREKTPEAAEEDSDAVIGEMSIGDGVLEMWSAPETFEAAATLLVHLLGDFIEALDDDDAS